MEHFGMKTPTKKRPLDTSDVCLSPNSPKFMKPSEIFARRRVNQNLSSGSTTTSSGLPIKFSPSKPATASMRRCKLPIETVEKIYSPLKCLQQKQNSPDSKKSMLQRRITFSPLMKKLQRSPGRSNGFGIQFPVVRRSLQNIQNKKNISLEKFSRVLDFSEDAQLPEVSNLSAANEKSYQKLPSPSLVLYSSNEFFPLNQPYIDWSLKTRLRIVINRSLPFHGTFSFVDETNGLNRFVRGLGTSNDTEEASFCAELHRHCLVWQHPHLPWISRLFPRQPELKPGTSLSSKSPPMFAISPNGVIADSLHSDYCQALHSLFKLLKSKYCPYFYLCANHYVVLFRAGGVGGSDEANALITPTTIGLRRLLEEESIKYELPFHQNLPSDNPKNQDETSNASSGIEPDLDEEEEDVDNDDEEIDFINQEEESNQWLESLGLSQQDFPSLETGKFRNRRRITLEQKNGSKNSTNQSSIIDDQSAQGRVKSLVRINGIHQLRTLIGLFVNNRKICIGSSGPLAGIPPTLLSPVPFHGATLRPITVTQKTHQKPTANQESPSTINRNQITTLDLNGPILPHSVYGLMMLFQRFLTTQNSTPNKSNDHQSQIKPTIIRSTLRTYDLSASFATEASIFRQQIKNKHDQKPKNDETNQRHQMTPLENNPKFSVENLQDSGMDRQLLLGLCCGDRQLGAPLVDFEISINGIRYNRFIQQQRPNNLTGSGPILSQKN